MEKRTCFNCKNKGLCFVFRDIINATNKFEVNIDGDAAPGKWIEIFDAVGNCCLKFSKINS